MWFYPVSTGYPGNDIEVLGPFKTTSSGLLFTSILIVAVVSVIEVFDDLEIFDQRQIGLSVVVESIFDRVPVDIEPPVFGPVQRDRGFIHKGGI